MSNLPANIDHSDAPATPPSAPQTVGTQALQNLQMQANAMRNAMQIAEAMCATEMVPKHFKGKPADGAAAILYGAELGLNATQSLQQVMVINGKPGIETRTAMALLIKQGYVVETLETSDQCVTVKITAPRGNHEIASWDIERATKAGYLSNKLYKTIPQQMLYAKAAMEAARKIAPHVLSGIAYSTEELQLERIKATATRTDHGMGAVREALAQKQQPAQQQDEPAQAMSEFATESLAAIESVSTMDELTEVMGWARPDDMPAVEIDAIRDAANRKARSEGWA
ncbi:hypothetical protein [Corynebacterium ulceribovis]|uniref:hypothetical protein n=1 Tax=Corynebacterium ulceribovis TaxID=487732 RepID=UPI00035EF45F|nr:hypothetical protein [Corynebacterium ulceribovis]